MKIYNNLGEKNLVTKNSLTLDNQTICYILRISTLCTHTYIIITAQYLVVPLLLF